MKYPIKLFLIISFLAAPMAHAQYSPDNLYSAARAGNKAKLLDILSENQSVETLNAALGAAVIGDRLEAMQILIDRGANVDHLSSYNTPLLINAIMHGHFKAARFLIENGANVNVKGFRKLQNGVFLEWHWTPLMCAAYKGDLTLIKKLEEKGARLDETGWSATVDDIESAADIAAYSGHLQVLRYLVGQNVRYNKNTIFRAARGGHIATIQFLLEQGADINALSPKGKTLLMIASWWGHTDLVEFLLDKGANINQLSKDGFSALGEAVSNNDKEFNRQIEVVKLLVERGADVNNAQAFKMTPLMRAVEADQWHIVDYLISNGAR